jgi:hypothetical protein
MLSCIDKPQISVVKKLMHGDIRGAAPQKFDEEQ